MNTNTQTNTQTRRTETYKNLRFEIAEGVSQHTGKPILTGKAWRGKALKHYAYFSFQTPERLAAWIEEQKGCADRAETYRAERKLGEAERTAQIVAAISVGTLLCYTWGYEQTNQDFFQVTEKSGRAVKIRPIARTMDEDAGCGPMSGRVPPLPDQFTGEAIKKIIGACGIRMDHGIATPTTADKKHYCSWYA